jgi:hypothetical protein
VERAVADAFLRKPEDVTRIVRTLARLVTNGGGT